MSSLARCECIFHLKKWDFLSVETRKFIFPVEATSTQKPQKASITFHTFWSGVVLNILAYLCQEVVKMKFKVKRKFLFLCLFHIWNVGWMDEILN